jgi:RHS repeat-associated protein
LLTATTAPDGHVTTRTYDPAQNLTSVSDPSGAVTAIAYDADNRPTTVTDAKGGTTVFGYDITGRITSVTDPGGRKTSYAYDPADRVVSITDPSGAVTKYGYDPAGDQTSSTDATGRVSGFTYDALNRVIAAVDPAGAESAYAYDPAGQLTKITDPNGHAHTFAYTADGQTASATDGAGDTTTYAYDLVGNITGITDPRGGSVSFTYNGNDQLTGQSNQDGNTTSYGYTAAGLESSMTDPLGITTSYNHDPTGLLTQVIENATGTGTGTDVKATSSYAYDANGRLVKTTNPAGASRSYAYDPLGNLTSSTDPLGKITSYSYDAASQVTSRVDANGTTTGYGYDPAGRVSTLTPPSGQHPVSYSYDAAGRMTGMTDGTGTSGWTYTQAGQVATATDGNGKTLAYGFDPAGNRTSLTYPDGVKAAYGYDAADRITSLTTSGGPTKAGTGAGSVSYGYDASSELTGITRPNGTATSYTYDPAGQLTQINHTAPAGASGNSADATPLTPTVSNPTPAAPTPGPASGGGASTQSATASPISTGGLTPAVSTPSPIPAQPASSGGTAAGTDSASASALTTPVTAAAGGPTCGLLSLLLGCTATTKTAVTALPLKLDYSYDKDGRVSAQNQSDSAGTLDTSYSYDGLGRLTGSTRSDGINSSYSYNSAGDRTASTTVDPVTGALIASTATYNAADELTGQVSTATLGSHTSRNTTSNAYDNNGNLTTATTTHTSSDSSLLGSLLGPILSTLFGLGAGTQTTHYAYDFNDKLTSVTAPDPTSTPADPASQQSITSTFAYDGLGRATGQSIGEPHHLNRLLQLDVRLGLPGASADVGVDLDGQPCNGHTSSTCRATLTTFGGDSTDVTYDGATPVAWSDTATRGADAGRSLDIIDGPEGPDQQTDSVYGTAYLHLDRLGSVRDITGPAGHTEAAAAYDDFGNPEPAPGTHQIGGLLTGLVTAAGGLLGALLGALLGSAPVAPYANTSSATPLGYTGQPSDPAHGLTLFPARSYNPAQAAWLQCDPHSGALADPARLNHYDYVNQNPVTLIDPTGADPAYANCTTTACRNYMYGGPDASNCAGIGGVLSSVIGSSVGGCTPTPQPPNAASAPNTCLPGASGANCYGHTQPTYSAGGGDGSGGSTSPPNQSAPAQATPRYQVHNPARLQAEIRMIISENPDSWNIPGSPAYNAMMEYIHHAIYGGPSLADFGKALAGPALSLTIAAVGAVLCPESAGAGCAAAVGAISGFAGSCVEDCSNVQSVALATIAGLLIGGSAGSGTGAEEGGGLRGAGDACASTVIDGGRADGETVFAGHGEYRYGSGDTVVPDGTTLKVYSPHGGTISDSTGLAIELGLGPAAVTTYGPGSVVPNYTLKPPTGLTVMSGSTTVDAPTQLSGLLQPGMGTVNWAACTEVAC